VTARISTLFSHRLVKAGSFLTNRIAGTAYEWAVAETPLLGRRAPLLSSLNPGVLRGATVMERVLTLSLRQATKNPRLLPDLEVPLVDTQGLNLGIEGRGSHAEPNCSA
jgi:hypothetical protein